MGAVESVVFLGDYETILPGLGVYKPGQVIDDPEKVDRIIFSQYRKHFLEKNTYDKRLVAEAKKRQAEEKKRLAELDKDRAVGEAELKRSEDGEK